jgi:hypothetical protein
MINAASFVADEVQDSVYGIDGKVDVTFQGQTRRLRAYKQTSVHGEIINAYGIGVKYRTGMKVWHGYVSLYVARGTETIHGGLDNKNGNAGISTVLGFYDDVKDAYKSKR